MRRTVRDLDARRKAELREESTSDQQPEQTLTPAEAQRQRRLRDVTAQLEDMDVELKGRQQDEKRLRDLIVEYQMKLDAVPTRESELVELTRDYTTLQTSYQSLLQKREDSKIAANLERRNIGEQFRVLDPARVPERPFSPNRLIINLAGAAAGLALGLLFVGFLEYRDSSLKFEQDVERLLNLPVLALVPLMMSDDEMRRARVRHATFVSFVTLVVVVGSVVAVALWRVHALH